MNKQNTEESRLDRIERGIEEFINGVQELKESQKKTDEQIANSAARIEKMQEATDKRLNKTMKKLDQVGKQLANLGFGQGEVAEDLFYRNTKETFKKKGIVFHNIKRNLKKKGFGEYDIVAQNSESVLVIEVKHKLKKDLVDKFVNKGLLRFKSLFPEYKGYKLLGGVGALVLSEDINNYAQKAGLYVLTQSDNGGTSLANPEGFKAKEFS